MAKRRQEWKSELHPEEEEKKRKRNEPGKARSVNGCGAEKVMGDLSGAWPGPLDSIFGGACVVAACPARENKELEKKTWR